MSTSQTVYPVVWTDNTTGAPAQEPTTSPIAVTSAIPYVTSGYAQVYDETVFPRLSVNGRFLMVQDLRGKERVISVMGIESVSEHGNGKTIIRTQSGDFHTVKHSLKSIMKVVESGGYDTGTLWK